MDPIVLSLVLAAALLHASWNALVKAGGDPFVRLAVVNRGRRPVHAAARCSWSTPPAPRELAVSDRLGAGAPRLLPGACVRLSLRRPVARLPDRARHRAAAGRLRRVGLCRREPRARSGCSRSWSSPAASSASRSPTTAGWSRSSRSALGLVTGITIAAYTLFDGLGGRAAGDVLGYIAWLFVIDARAVQPDGRLPLSPSARPGACRVLAAGSARRRPVGGRLRPGDLGDDPDARWPRSRRCARPA